MSSARRIRRLVSSRINFSTRVLVAVLTLNGRGPRGWRGATETRDLAETRSLQHQGALNGLASSLAASLLQISGMSLQHGAGARRPDMSFGVTSALLLRRDGRRYMLVRAARPTDGFEPSLQEIVRPCFPSSSPVSCKRFPFGRLGTLTTPSSSSMLPEPSHRAIRLLSLVGLVVVASALLWTTPSVTRTSPRFVEALCGAHCSDLRRDFAALHQAISDSPVRPSPLPWFDSIQVISLAARAERRSHMESLDAVLGLNFTYFDAVTTADPRVAVRVEKWKVSKGWSHFAVPTQQACRLSHTDLLQKLEAANENATLILEGTFRLCRRSHHHLPMLHVAPVILDDIDIELDFRYLAGTVLRDVPPDWDMIFFGHTNIPGVTSEYKHGLAKEAHNSHIYTSVEPRGALAFPSTCRTY